MKNPKSLKILSEIIINIILSIKFNVHLPVDNGYNYIVMY